MSKTYFEILRAGVNTTIQDKGRNHLYHVGIAVSGAIDQRNYLLSNKLIENQLNEAVIEFAHQGPLLKLKNGQINFAISGDIFFKIIRKNLEVEDGECYKSYILNEEDQIDIISTKNSAYGYLAVNGGFDLKKTWGSYSKNTKANIGPNDGKKYALNDKIFIKKSEIKNLEKRKINLNKKILIIGGTGFLGYHLAKKCLL